jgi:hypothetical protein
MITADHAMEQAHATARKYAYEGIKAFEDLTHFDSMKNPQALATFVAGFMQAASIDFMGWAIQNQIEKLSGSLDYGSTLNADSLNDILEVLDHRLPKQD